MTAALSLKELITYRELLRNLVVRDLKLRYRKSFFGFLWSLINPLLMMAVFTVVFTVLLRNRDIPNFPVFVLVGILVWNLHASCLTGAMTSIIEAAPLVNKIYFPRIVLPMSVVLSNVVNFLFSLVAFALIAVIFSVNFSFSIALLPVVMLAQVLLCLGFAFILSTLNVFFRDTQIIMESLLLGWFFLTPIFYRMESLFPDYARLVYILNPLASLIEAYRSILYAGAMPDVYFLGRTLLSCALCAVVGFLIFQRYAPRLSEEL